MPVRGEKGRYVGRAPRPVQAAPRLVDGAPRLEDAAPRLEQEAAPRLVEAVPRMVRAPRPARHRSPSPPITLLHHMRCDYFSQQSDVRVTESSRKRKKAIMKRF